jgi:hypothetical protein
MIADSFDECENIVLGIGDIAAEANTISAVALVCRRPSRSKYDPWHI